MTHLMMPRRQTQLDRILRPGSRIVLVVVGASTHELPSGRFREVHLRMDLMRVAQRLLHELLIALAVKMRTVRCDTIDCPHGSPRPSYRQPSDCVLPVVT